MTMNSLLEWGARDLVKLFSIAMTSQVSHSDKPCACSAARSERAETSLLMAQPNSSDVVTIRTPFYIWRCIFGGFSMYTTSAATCISAATGSSPITTTHQPE